MSDQNFDEGAPTTVAQARRRKRRTQPRPGLPGMTPAAGRGDFVNRGRQALDTVLNGSATWGAGLLLGYVIAHVVWQFVAVNLVLQPLGISFGRGWKTAISPRELIAIALLGTTIFYAFRGDPKLLKRFVVIGAAVWAFAAILK